MKKTYQQLLDEEVAALKRSLEDLQAPEGTTKGEWLRTLHDAAAERFLSDNGRIWTTGAIMIPLSLAPFAVLPLINNPEAVHFWMLGLASVTVYLAWLIIADGHRQFQDKSLAWIIAIQQTIGLKNTGKPQVGEYWLTKHITVRRMRYAILAELIVGWLVAASYWLPSA